MKKISMYFHRSHEAKKKIGDDPSRDWRLILFYFVVFLVLILAIDAFLYKKLSITGGNVTIQNQSNQILNRNDFDQMVDMLNNQNINPVSVSEMVKIDPSI